LGFKLVHASINANDFPHHLNDSTAAFVVETIIELTGDMVEINRASIGCDSVLDQLNGGEIGACPAAQPAGMKPSLSLSIAI
jgi:hypothetical protein